MPVTFYNYTYVGNGSWYLTRDDACNQPPNGVFTYRMNADGLQCDFFNQGRYWTSYNANTRIRCSDGGYVNSSKPLDQQCMTPPPLTCPLTGQTAGEHLACIKQLTYECASCAVENSIFPARGNIVQNEIRYAAASVGDLSLVDTYRSDWAISPRAGLGSRWTHNWARTLDTVAAGNVEPAIVAIRADGRPIPFYKDTTTGAWTVAQAISMDRLEAMPPGDPSGARWRYTDAASDTQEQYDDRGRLLSVRERNGWTTTLSYSDASTPANLAPQAGLLLQVSNQFGRTLNFTYDATARVAAVSGSSGQIVTYTYNASGLPERATWANGMSRQYHYEDPVAFGGLTGITDEAGVRFSSYSYDGQGRATSSEHAGGVGKVLLQYLEGAQTTVTTAVGSSRTITFQSQGGVTHPTSVSAPCPECGNVAKTTAYDTSGNVSSRVDFDNRETRYNYDARGRETQRIEGYGSADAKTTTTEWHPTWNLPLKVAAPSRVDYFSYDAKGQVLAYSWYQTNDANGSQGLNAQPSGDVTSTNWTYDANGLVATAVDKLGSTVTGQWAFTYDAQGNLASVANMAGQTGSAVQYDAAGRLLEAVDVSGSRIKYAYDGRGRMTDVDNDGIHTKYEYDAVGQLVGIIGPYDLVTRYTYDAAHRLIQILDNITIPEAVNDFGLVSPFTVEGAAAPSSLAYVSNRLASGWNVVIRWLKDWLSAVISSAQAQAIPLPNQYVPPIRPGQSLPAYPGSSAAPDLDPSLTPAKVAPGMYVLRFLVKIQKGCGTAVEAIKEVFDMSKPPGDCDEDEHRRLQENVNQACDKSGQLKCKVDDVKEVLMQKMTLSRRCALARTKINDACFRGSDGNHRREAQKRWGTFDNCEKLFNKLN
ncbi:RHS repeat domain-containing protein [Cupriavidus metallidurans]|uniref:RHS repeat domain-containing protein n=1 Tax=Cupriavidus metallidurans TaxID=119219 RepID=UPI003D02FEB3